MVAVVVGGAILDLKRLLSPSVGPQARKREGDLDEGKSTLVSELTIKVRLSDTKWIERKKKKD